MSDIFISYASEDRPRAEMLAQAFEDREWSIFWDRTIPTGKTWRETIGRELNDARCVIVLWSKTSIESGWVQEEADDAKRRGILVPVLIENVQPPIGFRGIQAADLVGWDAKQSTHRFRRLIADIAALIGPPPKEAKKRKTKTTKEEDEREQPNAEGYEEWEKRAPKRREEWVKAAAEGDASAMNHLGFMYEVGPPGYGLRKDYAKAREWYEKAAAKGHVNSMSRLGYLYRNPRGVLGVLFRLGVDYAKAREWYEKAAAKGDADAMCQVGTFYESGQGVAKDYAKAREWYEKAAANGHGVARFLLKNPPFD